MTNYVQNVLDNISDDGMTPDLWEIVNKDIGRMRSLNVSNRREQTLLFYIRRFLNDILSELGEVRTQGLAAKVFNILRDKEDVGLDDIKEAVASCIRTKVAYPNAMGLYRYYDQQKVDISKWISVMAEVAKANDKRAVLNRLTAEWNDTEKYNFIQWMKYYEENNHMKYGIDKQANDLNFLFDQDFFAEQNVEDVDFKSMPELQPEQKIAPKADKDLVYYKTSLISRLRAAERILEKFSDILTPQQWDYLYHTLTSLRGEVTKLKLAQTISDRVVRAASIFEKNNFQEGAAELRKVAAPSGIAKKIEQALGGGPPGGAEGMGEDDLGLGMNEDMPAEEAPVEEGAPAGGEDLGVGDLDLGAQEGGEGAELEEPPQGEAPEADLEVAEPEPEPEPDLEVDEPDEVVGTDNPFSSSSPEDVINLLNPLLQNLRNRSNVRILTKADMMLDGQGISVYLPELSEAIAKQIECDNYIANRLEKIMGKLQGSQANGQIEEAPLPAAPAPSVEMGELTGEADLEVEEPAIEPAAAPAAAPAAPAAEEPIAEVPATPPAETAVETPPEG